VTARIAAALAVATLAGVASLATPAAAQPRYHGNEQWNRGHGENREYHNHPGWDNGYYARPPVAYGSPYRYGYVAPPPVIYNPGIGIYLPGITLGIH
jgi:hypothetical protein